MGLLKQLKLTRDRRRFYYLMLTMGLDGFSLVEQRKIAYGHELIISIPPSKSVKDFVAKQDNLKSWFKGIVQIEELPFRSVLKLTVITEDLGKYPYTPVICPSNKLWLSKDINGEDVFLNLDKEAHVLIGGKTGCGKTFLEALILTNLIHQQGSHIDLHLSQIVKGEIGRFADCKCVKSVNYTLEDVLVQLTALVDVIEYRSKMFTQLGINNVTHYNKKSKRKLKRKFCVIEEVSFFTPTETDSDEVKALKNKCLEAILLIVKTGRGCGVHFISVTQRSTVANIPSEVKAQTVCITGKQRSGLDSRNIIDVEDAKDLRDGEFILFGDSGLRRLKVPVIDEDFLCLQEYVKEIKVFREDARGTVEVLEDAPIRVVQPPIPLSPQSPQPTQKEQKEQKNNKTVKISRKKGVTAL